MSVASTIAGAILHAPTQHASSLLIVALSSASPWVIASFIALPLIPFSPSLVVLDELQGQIVAAVDSSKVSVEVVPSSEA